MAVILPTYGYVTLQILDPTGEKICRCRSVSVPRVGERVRICAGNDEQVHDDLQVRSVIHTLSVTAGHVIVTIETEPVGATEPRH
jgi:hypothetical protein